MKAQSIEQIEIMRAKAHKRLEPLDDGYDYEYGCDAYEAAFNLVDDALEIAIRLIKELTNESI